MCGRFISGADVISWSEYCEILRLPPNTPPPVEGDRAPSQDISAIRTSSELESREHVVLRWGLIPHWLKRREDALNIINIRSETAPKKFRHFFERRRCLIPAAGFYEWMKLPTGKKKIKHRIRDTDRPLISMAGLHARWTGPDGEVVESCAILTTEPCDVVRPIHNRMPVILPDDALDLWLDPGAARNDLESILVPYTAETLVAEPLEPIPSAPEQGALF